MTELSPYKKFSLTLLTLYTFTHSTHRISTEHIFINRTFQTKKKLTQKLIIFRWARYQDFSDIITLKFSWSFFNSTKFRDNPHMGNHKNFCRKLSKVLVSTLSFVFRKNFGPSAQIFFSSQAFSILNFQINWKFSYIKSFRSMGISNHVFRMIIKLWL